MRLAPFALLLGTLALGACDDNNDVINSLPITGSWALRSTNGVSVPAVIDQSDSPPLVVAVINGRLDVNSDGTFSRTLTFRRSLSGTETVFAVTCAGTYTNVNGDATFTEDGSSPDCSSSFDAVQVDNQMTTDRDGVVDFWIR
jgi:hypothetical protein